MIYNATVKLSQLKLDTLNYRLGQTGSQRDTIKAMIADQKRKLINHASDIIKVGLSPGEFCWVMPDPKDSKMFVVLEGNRRVASLKLLETPALADGTIVERPFRQMAKKYYENPVRELAVCVFPTRAEARPWIRRRHMSSASGVGLQRWKPPAKGRAMRDEGEAAPRFLAVMELLDDGTEAWAEIELALDNRWTTVDRVLNAGSFPKILGINIHSRSGKVDFENGNAAEGKALLQRILSVMASPDFDFADIERATDREKFISGFSEWAVKKKTTDGHQQGKSKADKSAESRADKTKRGRASKDLKDRTTLAPKSGSRMLHVDNPRLNGIYSECRSINVKDHENACALLLRVFIELSSEALLATVNVPIPQRLQKEGKQHWGDIGVPLGTKIDSVIDYLDPTKKAKAFQQARLGAQASARSSYSIHTLHGYFHNLKLIPNADEIKGAWNSWEAYLHAVHTALNIAND